VSHAEFEPLRKEAQRRMKSAIEVLQKEFSGLRTGRASVSLLEPIVVDAYGAQMPITQVATLSTPEPRLLSVQVWDRSLVKAVEKAIKESGLGLNPIVEGQTLRLPIPPLTEQRRVELTKIAARYAEEARVSIRNIRRHFMDELKKLEKDAKISEDELHDYSAELQGLTDSHIKQVDQHLTNKDQEIMQV
jgi:ribosome recycling factor